MLRLRVLPGDVFVREFGGKVCAMPSPDGSVAVEVCARGELPLDAFRRMVDHLTRGVTLVLYLSEQSRFVTVFRDDTAPTQFKEGESLVVPDLLPGFAVPVARFFE